MYDAHIWYFIVLCCLPIDFACILQGYLTLVGHSSSVSLSNSENYFDQYDMYNKKWYIHNKTKHNKTMGHTAVAPFTNMDKL